MYACREEANEEQSVHFKGGESWWRQERQMEPAQATLVSSLTGWEGRTQIQGGMIPNRIIGPDPRPVLAADMLLPSRRTFLTPPLRPPGHAWRACTCSSPRHVILWKKKKERTLGPAPPGPTLEKVEQGNPLPAPQASPTRFPVRADHHHRCTAHMMYARATRVRPEHSVWHLERTFLDLATPKILPERARLLNSEPCRSILADHQD